MTVTITVYFSHNEESLYTILKNITGFHPKLKKLGMNNNYFPVYSCEFNCAEKNDLSILQTLQKMKIHIGEIKH